MYFFQLWCATGVNLSGGRTRDGGDIVGASVFYSHPPSDDENGKADESDSDAENEEINKINEELKVKYPQFMVQLVTN